MIPVYCQAHWRHDWSTARSVQRTARGLGQDSQAVSQDIPANGREKSNPARSTESRSNFYFDAVGDWRKGSCTYTYEDIEMSSEKRKKHQPDICRLQNSWCTFAQSSLWWPALLLELLNERFGSSDRIIPVSDKQDHTAEARLSMDDIEWNHCITN